MIERILIEGLIWIALGILGAGFEFAYLQDEWPSLAVKNWEEDLAHSIGLGLFGGPMALIVFLLITQAKHGWRLWTRS